MRLGSALGLAFAASTAAAGCGPSPDACPIAGGEYHLELPGAEAEKPPVLMFLHGAGGNGQNVMRNRTMVDAALARGYAVLAPTGARQFRGGKGRLWVFYPGWEGRDETAFLKSVIQDATQRFDIDRGRVLLAGFSAGGFMVHYLACAAPETFAAYAPVSGGFWRPHPTACKGPVKLFHTHGWRDTTVPMEGRYLGNGRFQQGDIFAGLEIWRQANACPDQSPDGYAQTGDFMRRVWSKCAPGSALEFALFPGGHAVPKGWSEMVIDWFETVTGR
ncbi:CE1 family esterase [Arenibacterium sp. CAU 1754]